MNGLIDGVGERRTLEGGGAAEKSNVMLKHRTVAEE